MTTPNHKPYLAGVALREEQRKAIREARDPIADAVAAEIKTLRDSSEFYRTNNMAVWSTLVNRFGWPSNEVVAVLYPKASS